MKCNSAREILNRIFDGDDHPLAEQARQHLQECDACGDWHTSTVRVVEALGSCEEIDVPDIAGMVSRRLPAAHPASVGGRNPARQWLLGALAACWLIGGGVLLAGAVIVTQWLNTGSIADAWSFARSFREVLGGFASAGRPLIGAAGHVLSGLGGAIWSLGPILLAIVMIDLAGLAIVLLVWRRRLRVSSACFI
jgi:hypothetical protein